jgi:uncharacterized protein (TIGR00375 family)
MIAYTDLHLHGPNAGGTSKNLSIELIAKYSRLKGLNLTATGDILNKEWLDKVKSELQQENSSFYFDLDGKKQNIILQTEIETVGRVHHILLFPDYETVENVRSVLGKYAKLDGYMNGRPRIALPAEKTFKLLETEDLIFGPAHAFTPYFSIYAHYNSLKDAYGEFLDLVAFMELGLSADSYGANNIAELKNIPFLSNSDAHSFWPHRMGREFNKFDISSLDYKGLKEGLKHWKDRQLLNVGLNPQEGMYNRTACSSCYKIYSLKQAIQNNWKCDCGKPIKKGVSERIEELSSPGQEYKRAKYIHTLPLAEIIMLALNSKTVFSKQVQDLGQKFVDEVGTEIDVLLATKEDKLYEIDRTVAKYISAFRNGFVVYRPGGGGSYGIPYITFSEQEKAQKQAEIDAEILGKSKQIQKTLF